MTKRDFLSLAIKVISLNFLVSCFTGLISIVIMFNTPEFPRQTWTVSLVSQFAIFFLLLIFSDKISEMLIKEDRQLNFPESIKEPQNIFKLVLKIVGVIWIVSAGSSLIEQVYSVYHYSDNHYVRKVYVETRSGGIIKNCIELVVGVFFVLESKFFDKFIRFVFKKNKYVL
ncbi:MAG: hypothetical protein Q7K21_02610 [Elusimicrobiota bacterium]|nr:hypothetical protein [Elusimicrobiota bacterium]